VQPTSTPTGRTPAGPATRDEALAALGIPGTVEVAVDGEHDQRAVLEHVLDVGPTPPLGRGLDEWPALLGVRDHSGGRREIRDDPVLEVDDDSGIGPDVVDPVPGPVGSGHPRDEQLAVLVVQEDLDPALSARTATGRRQVDDLAAMQGRADGVIHG
jgi:hypothetical protein